jgi:hypothetical protein
MKRITATALAAATVSGTLLIATPAFAANPGKGVTLHVKPSTVYNNESTAITAKCGDKWSTVTVSSPALGLNETGMKGKKLKVQLHIGWGVAPGTYPITAACSGKSGKPCKCDQSGNWSQSGQQDQAAEQGKSGNRGQTGKWGKPGKCKTKYLTVLQKTPPVPPVPPVPPKPPVIHPIPGFHPDVIVHTGFGGMAASVASHHPAG